MKYENARKAKELIEEFDAIEEELKHIVNQKEKIGTKHKLVINCKDDRDFSLNTVLIPSEDAKIVLQFLHEHYISKQAEILKKIDLLN